LTVKLAENHHGVVQKICTKFNAPSFCNDCDRSRSFHQYAQKLTLNTTAVKF